MVLHTHTHTHTHTLVKATPFTKVRFLKGSPVTCRRGSIICPITSPLLRRNPHPLANWPRFSLRAEVKKECWCVIEAPFRLMKKITPSLGPRPPLPTMSERQAFGSQPLPMLVFVSRLQTCSDTLTTAPQPPAVLFYFPQRQDSKRIKLGMLCNVFGTDDSREISPWAKRGPSRETQKRLGYF